MKCALVTGSSRGIGKAIALQLSKDLGLHILINFSSNEEAAKSTLSEIKKNGGSGELMQFNVVDSKVVSDKISKWQEENPSLYWPSDFHLNFSDFALRIWGIEKIIEEIEKQKEQMGDHHDKLEKEHKILRKGETQHLFKEAREELED